MRKTTGIRRLIVMLVAFVMVLTATAGGTGGTAYAVGAKKLTAKTSYVAYEGQAFSEKSFRKNTTVKLGKTKVTKYKVSAPKYVKTNGTGRNKGKFVVKITYKGKSITQVVTLRKISRIYVKKSTNAPLCSGTVFNAADFKKNTVVYADYKAGKKTVSKKLTSYTVKSAAKVSANMTGGYYKVTIKCGGKSVTKGLDVITEKLAATSSSKTLNEGEKFDAAAFKKTVTVKKLLATGKPSGSKVTAFTIVDAPKTVTLNSKTYSGKMAVKVKAENQSTYAYVNVNPLTKIAATYNSSTTLKEGSTFNESDFRRNVTVKANYTTSSANKTITDYTVSVPSKTVSANASGNYVVTIKYGSKTTTVNIPTELTMKEIDVIQKDSSTSPKIANGASFSKEEFEKTFDVYKVFSNDIKEKTTDYTISAPSTVSANGSDENTFVVTVNYQNCSKQTSYEIINTVDWLGYYTLTDNKYYVSPDTDEIIINGSADIPEYYLENYEFAFWRILLSKTDSNPTFFTFDLLSQFKFTTSIQTQFAIQCEGLLEENSTFYLRTYAIFFEKGSKTEGTPKKENVFYSNEVIKANFVYTY